MRKHGIVCMFEQARLEYFGKAKRGALVTTVQKQLRAYERKKVRKANANEANRQAGSEKAG